MAQLHPAAGHLLAFAAEHLLLYLSLLHLLSLACTCCTSLMCLFLPHSLPAPPPSYTHYPPLLHFHTLVHCPPLHPASPHHATCILCISCMKTGIFFFLWMGQDNGRTGWVEDKMDDKTRQDSWAVWLCFGILRFGVVFVSFCGCVHTLVMVVVVNAFPLAAARQRTCGVAWLTVPTTLCLPTLPSPLPPPPLLTTYYSTPTFPPRAFSSWLRALPVLVPGDPLHHLLATFVQTCILVEEGLLFIGILFVVDLMFWQRGILCCAWHFGLWTLFDVMHWCCDAFLPLMTSNRQQ